MENNLRASAFEALSEVIEAVGGVECYVTMQGVLRELSAWLQRSFDVSGPVNEEILQLQGLICGCLNNLVTRLGKRLGNNQTCNSIFDLLVKVIETGTTSGKHVTVAGINISSGPAGAEGLGSSEERAKVGSEEDAILAVGTLVRSKHWLEKCTSCVTDLNVNSCFLIHVLGYLSI